MSVKNAVGRTDTVLPHSHTFASGSGRPGTGGAAYAEPERVSI
jgi:hypothetical protein